MITFLIVLAVAISLALLIGAAIIATAPDVLGVQKRAPKHRAEPASRGKAATR